MPLYTSWTITCHSPEQCQSLQHWLASHIDLDRVLTDTARAFPNGVEREEAVPHRLGNYFAAIRMLPASAPSSFRLVFHKLSQAGRFWKDLMVNILQEIEASGEKASIALDYKGDEEPATMHAPC